MQSLDEFERISYNVLMPRIRVLIKAENGEGAVVKNNALEVFKFNCSKYGPNSTHISEGGFLLHPEKLPDNRKSREREPAYGNRTSERSGKTARNGKYAPADGGQPKIRPQGQKSNWTR